MPALSHSLDPLFRPAAVAVFGAGEGSAGSFLVRNLLDSPFGGVVYPIRADCRAVHGVACHADLDAVPGPIDLAVIAEPAAAVPAIVGQCVARGVKAAVIVSAGFSERGAQGRALEQEVGRLARGRMRVLGPGSFGLLHPPGGLNASLAAGMARPGHVALLSQSGAIGSSILDWAREAYVGFSAFVGVGTMLDVDFADLLDYFADDPQTHSVLLYLESLGDVRKFLSAARPVARTKPVIVVKAGRHEAGARAAAAHTGALAGADAVYDAAFRRAGVLRVASIPDLFNMAEILATQPRPRGPALAVITNAGGPGVMAADALLLAGGRLTELAPTTLAALDAALPPFWSRANPIDLLGDAGPEHYRRAVAACAGDPGVQGLLVLLAPQALTDPTETARQLAPFARLENKPVLASWLGGPAVRPGREILNRAGIPTFDSPEAAVRAFLHMVQYHKAQELLYETPAALSEDWAPDPERAGRIIAAARAAGRTLLTEVESKQLLAARGIPATPTLAAPTADAAVAAARRLGYPVVLKLLSQTVTHKSDVGGVRLHLDDDAAVCQAFAAIAADLARHRPDVRFEGVTVQPMIRDRGVELIVGSTADAQFGPVILFGAGGLWAEVLGDTALGLPPLNRALARRLIEQTRVFRALQGVRGGPPVNFDQLETLLVRFSFLLCDCPDIAEIDVNPLLATPDRVVALDARVLLTPPDLPDARRPRPVIRPYPAQYITAWRLQDGTNVILRPICPEDAPLIVELHEGHSAHTIRMRFFSMVKTLSRDSLVRLCHLDYDREMALVAVRRDEQGRPHLLGVSRYYLEPETGTAEFAVVVGDRWQGKGLGRHLMERLIAVAREQGVKRLTGAVLRENTAMLRLMQGLGFTERPGADRGEVEVELAIGCL